MREKKRRLEFYGGEKEDEEKMRYQSGDKREDKIEYGRGNKSTINKLNEINIKHR